MPSQAVPEPVVSAGSASLPASFRRLAWSNLAAQSAEQIGLAAAPIIAVLALGAGAGETGLLQTAQTLPFLLLSIPAGILADRMSRRHLMVSAEAVRAISLLAIFTLAAGGHIGLLGLAVLGFVGAAGTVAYSVGAPALVPALVPHALLGLANGRIELARATAFAAGPTAAGALVTFIGGSNAFAVAAALSLVAVVLLAGVADPPTSAQERLRPFADLADGARMAFAHPWLRPIILTQIGFNIGYFVIQAVFVAYAVQHLGMGPTGIGLALGANGVGMVIGALIYPRLAARLPVGALVSIGPVSGLVASLCLVATIAVTSPALAGLGYFFIGVGPILWVISSTTIRQTVTPSAMLGRVSAIIATSGAGARPVGAFIGAAVGGTAGAAPCLVVAAFCFAVQAATILLSPLRAVDTLPEPTG